MTKRQILLDMGYEDSIVFENPDYDSAIVGVSDNGEVIYDFDKMVRWLMEEDGITAEEAADFICYNSIRSLPYVGEGAPIIMYSLLE